MRKLLLLLILIPVMSQAFVRGIYITQSTAENTKRMTQLIQEAKKDDVGTFIIDTDYRNTRYARNLEMVHKNGIKFVSRVVIFPHGGTRAQVTSKEYWNKRWAKAQYAISLGASAIQLDYIRYKHTNRGSAENAKDIYNVIDFFHNKLRGTKVELQIDVFGVAAHRPAIHIGQNIPLFAPLLDAVNPMVYPSHYEPFRHHAERPYHTVLDSVSALRKQLDKFPAVKVYAFIELFNYRYPMSTAKRLKYIHAQIQAAEDSGADGFYVWSARNKYSMLFQALKHAS